jgi:hypothetical protein
MTLCVCFLLELFLFVELLLTLAYLLVGRGSVIRLSTPQVHIVLGNESLPIPLEAYS